MRIVRLTLALFTVAFGACASPPRIVRREAPTFDEAMRSVSGVYLCEVQNDGGHARLFVSSVWLHDVRLSFPPSVGSELLLVRAPPSRPAEVKSVVVFYYESPVQTAQGGLVASRFFHVANSRIPILDLSLEDAERKVRSARKTR